MRDREVRCRSEIGLEGRGLEVERGQAYAANRDAVSRFQFWQNALRRDLNSAILALHIDAGHATNFFNNSGKHAVS
jgi:hypothetical protein